MKLSALVGGSSEVIGPEASLRMAAEAMIRADAASLAVIDGHELVGIITERDIVRAAAGDLWDDDTVADWMTPSPDVASPEVTVEEAAKWLLETGYRHLPVMDEGELLGVVSVRDLLWAVVHPE